MTSLDNKAVLVTGATGFLGSRLAEILSDSEKAQVTGTGRQLDKVSWLTDKGVDLEAVNLLDIEDLKTVVEGKDVVFHSAAALGGDPDMAHRVNVEATEKLVWLAGEAGVSRFVHVSTVGVYDMTGLSEVDETAPLATDHPSTYPRTKALAEVKAREMAEKVGLELAIVRPSMIYGPGHGIWSEGMFKNVMEGNPVFLGDGSAHFNPVYIDDVVGAMLLCAKHPNAAGEAFIVSAGVTTWREFMGHYGQLCGKEAKGLPMPIARLMAFANKIPFIKTPIDQGFIEMATSHKTFTTTKAADLIGWKPETDYTEGMEKTLQWLRENIYSE
jgi:nucleoside-diphosphate-sugar epimerase